MNLRWYIIISGILNFAVKEQCKLYCQADGYNFFYALSDEVKDGTPCNDHSSDICVHGKCQVKISSWMLNGFPKTVKEKFSLTQSLFVQRVGCDYIVGSTASKDQCGVCMGDNSTCNVFEGHFKEQPRRNSKKYLIGFLILKIVQNMTISRFEPLSSFIICHYQNLAPSSRHLIVVVMVSRDQIDLLQWVYSSWFIIIFWTLVLSTNSLLLEQIQIRRY